MFLLHTVVQFSEVLKRLDYTTQACLALLITRFSLIPVSDVLLFCLSPPEDDVDLEALVNDMNSSLESLYSTCSGQQTESTPLLHNGQSASSHQLHHHPHHTQLNQPRQGLHSHAQSHICPEPPTSSSPADSSHRSLRRSQPMHILAVRLVTPKHPQNIHVEVLLVNFSTVQ